MPPRRRGSTRASSPARSPSMPLPRRSESRPALDRTPARVGPTGFGTRETRQRHRDRACRSARPRAATQRTRSRRRPRGSTLPFASPMPNVCTISERVPSTNTSHDPSGIQAGSDASASVAVEHAAASRATSPRRVVADRSSDASKATAWPFGATAGSNSFTLERVTCSSELAASVVVSGLSDAAATEDATAKGRKSIVAAHRQPPYGFPLLAAHARDLPARRIVGPAVPGRTAVWNPGTLREEPVRKLRLVAEQECRSRPAEFPERVVGVHHDLVRRDVRRGASSSAASAFASAKLRRPLRLSLASRASPHPPPPSSCRFAPARS